MSTNPKISKRLLTTGLGVGALALMASRASADTSFTSFAFPATGAPTSRSMPDRLADIKNVLEFGADPTGASDSSTAFQNAINASSGNQRAIVFVPAGRYQISKTISLPMSIAITGDGQASYLQGNVNGFILDYFNTTGPNPLAQLVIEKLKITNSNATAGTGCVRLVGCINPVVRDCYVSGVIGITFYDDTSGAGSQSMLVENCDVHSYQSAGTAGTVGIWAEANSSIISCDLVGWDVAIHINGFGPHILGTRIEVCNTAILLGNTTNNDYAEAFFIGGGTTIEACLTGIYAASGSSAGVISAVHIHGTTGTPSGALSNYGIRLGPFGAATYIAVVGVLLDGSYAVNGISIGDNNSGGNHLGGLSFVSTLSPSWGMPSVACTAEFISCNNPAATFTFANLPSSPVEGMEYDITDCKANTFGAAAAGGGATHARIRYNGTNWTVMAI